LTLGILNREWAFPFDLIDVHAGGSLTEELEPCQH
jgi:hypothetical protein